MTALDIIALVALATGAGAPLFLMRHFYNFLKFRHKARRRRAHSR